MPLVSEYANGRSQLPFSSADLAVSAGGTTTVDHAYYFCLQGENPVGYNLPSAIVGPIDIPIGSQLTWTLPTTVRGTGEAWTGYCLSASLTNAASSFVQLARIASTDSDGNAITLPDSLTLGTDQQLALSGTASTGSALPGAEALSGMRRGVYDAGFVYEYNPQSVNTVDGLATLAAVAPSPGRWLRVGSFSNAITDNTAAGGCAQDIRDINELVVRYARYGCDGNNGRSMDFWLANTDSAAIPSGQRVMINVLLSEIPRSGAFEGALRATFKGYANLSTGAVRTTIAADGTTMRGLNTPIVFENRKTDLLFEDDLQPGEAYWLSLLPNFIPAYFNYGIANASLIKVFATIASQAGAYSAGGGALGNRIYDLYDKGLVVPAIGASVTCLKRSGFVNSREFLAVAAIGVGPLIHNTAGQLVRINGNGAVYLSSGSVLDTEATRAVVDLVAGVSNACAASAPVTVAGTQALAVTLTYPSNGTVGTIRSDYPDPLLQGNQQGKLNPIFVTVYVTIGGVIKAFPNKLLVDGATQTITLTDWDAGTVIGSVPAAPNSKFGLFAPVSATAIATGTGTNFPDGGSATVRYAFQYDGTSASAISHDRGDGCLYTATADLADVESAIAYWSLPVANEAALPSTGNLVGQIRQALDTGILYRWTGTAWAQAVTPAYLGDPVANYASLPAASSVPVGQLRLTLDLGKLYRSTGTSWVLASGGGSSSGVLNSWRFG